MPWPIGWTGKSALTSLLVTIVVALVYAFPDYYVVWAFAALAAAVFLVVFFRDPAYRYQRLAYWLAAAWVAAVVTPEVKARLRVGSDVDGRFEFGGQQSGWFHVAFVACFVTCLVLDYLTRRTGAWPEGLFSEWQLGGQRQSVTGGTAVQVSATDRAEVRVVVNSSTVDAELDNIKELLKQGKPRVAEDHAHRLHRRHWAEMNTQQRYRTQAYLGHAYHDVGENKKAAVHFANARDERPNDWEGQALGALAEYAAGRRENAYQFAAAVLRLHPASQVAATVYIRTAPGAATAAGLAREIDPAIVDETDVLDALAFRALTEGDTVAAERYSRKALASMPTHPHLKERVGQSIVLAEAQAATARYWGLISDASRERLVEAERLLTEALADSAAPQLDQEARSLRGLCRELLDRPAEAEADHVAASEVNPSEPMTAGRYAHFLARSDREGEALGVLHMGTFDPMTAELAHLYAALAVGSDDVAAKRRSLEVLEQHRPELVALGADKREDSIVVLAFLTYEVRGYDAASSAIDSFDDTLLTEASRRATRAEFLLKDGRQEDAEAEGTAALAAINPASTFNQRTRVAQALGRLKRWADALDVFRPVVSPTNLEWIGRRALAAANSCGDHQFLLDYPRQLREAGIWDPAAVELEIETLRKFHDPERAAALSLEFIERTPDEDARRAARLRLSLIGIGADREAWIETDESLLPAAESLSPVLGRVLAAVLLRGPNPFRAVQVAYELVRRHYRTSHHAHFALCQAVGFGRPSTPTIPAPTVSGPGVAVRYQLDGEDRDQWAVIEDSPDPDPARFEFPPDHPLCKVLSAKRPGDTFIYARNPYQPKQGTVLELRDKYHFRVLDTVARWAELFPEVFFVYAFDMRPGEGGKLDITPLLNALKEQRKDHEHVRTWYREHQVSALMYGVATRNTAVDSIRRLSADRLLPVRCCQGSLEEFEAGHAAAASPTIAVEGTALAALLLSGTSRHIAKLPFKLVVCQSAMEELRAFAQEQREGSDERLGTDGEQLIRVIISPDERKQLIDDTDSLVAWLAANASIRGGAALAALPSAIRNGLTDCFGQPAAEIAAVAHSEKIPLWTDDWALAGYSSGQLKTRRTWTQLVCDRLRATGGLPDSVFVELLVWLIAGGYQHTQCSPEAILRAGQVSEWDADRPPFKAVVGWLGNEHIQFDGLTAVAAGTIRLVWRDVPLAHQRDAATTAIGNALINRPDGREIVRALVTLMDRLFPYELHLANQCRTALRRSLTSFHPVHSRLIVP